ncbi:MAG: hypothetical protein EA349_03940 [Halomonadaceae bacterium]|nr:MAG: hypothetical protein EA349_03940 [Halomonadaceae bacterium]
MRCQTLHHPSQPAFPGLGVLTGQLGQGTGFQPNQRTLPISVMEQHLFSTFLNKIPVVPRQLGHEPHKITGIQSPGGIIPIQKHRQLTFYPGKQLVQMGFSAAM